MERPSRQVDPLTASLEITSAFSTQVNTGVPVEIVDAENQTVEAVLANEDGVSADEAMDISLEDEHKLDSTRLSAIPKTVAVPVPEIPKVSKPGGSEGFSRLPGGVSNPSTDARQSESLLRSVTNQLSTSTDTMESSAMQSVVNTQVNMASQLQGVPSAIEQLSQSLSGAQGLEISADAISTLADNLTAHMAQSGNDGLTGGPVDREQGIFHPNVNYGLEKFSIAGDSAGSMDPTGVLHEPESPSSSESNFDSSDLLNTSLLHQDEVTQRLANSGPVGVAAAAAILSGRKRKRQHMFESNPSLRKRHCSKLTKRLKETIEELTTRVGLQAVVVTFRPAKGGVESKNEASFKVFGAAPLTNVVKNQKEAIVGEMNAALHQQAPPVQPQTNTQQGEPLFDLPPLTFDGIPTPVNKMTQAQLRTFIPNMLKFSTGRGKPGWGKEDVKPTWWPAEVPWANVRSDARSEEEKKKLPWTDCLRRIVISCYIHHGRVDLLPEFSIEHLQQILTPEATEQLQVHLDSLQQQQATSVAMSIEGTGGGDGGETMSSLSNVSATPTGNRGSEDLMTGDNQQVFTVDTGIGSCDTTGMPTLADASLAETAARLQQVADETGEVQYATQSVIVTERDAKALGQPVGSTTTVLLTAYPGGHSGTVNDPVTAPPENTSVPQPFLSSTQSTSATTNIQVVYSASHIDSIPDSIVSDMSTPVTQTEPFNVTSEPSSQSSHGGGGGGGGGEMSQEPATGNEYLATTGLVGNVGGSNSNEGDSPSDLATQLINEYAAAAAAQDPSSALASTSIGDQLSGTTSTLTNKTTEE